jgi:hypothetical protein
LTLGNLNISTELGNSLIEKDTCRTDPYSLYRQTCVNNELNISLEHSSSEQRITVLDQIAMLVYKYKDLKLGKKSDGTPSRSSTVRAGIGALLEAK